MKAIAILMAVGTIACASPNPAPEATDTPGQQVTEPEVPTACVPSAGMAVAGRPSPYDSATVMVAGKMARVCYGRPFLKGREMFGGHLPWDALWRTGANEPTILHLPFRADIAGMDVPAGSYSVYTVPKRTGDWDLVLNKSTSQWGHESSYTPEIQAQELGRRPLKTERLNEVVEQFTIRGEPTSGGADILLEWERTRVRIPVRPVGG